MAAHKISNKLKNHMKQ